MTKKQLQKTVNQLVDISFKDGKVLEAQVIRSIRVLKSLPRSQAIAALSEYVKELKRKEREHTLYIETTIPLSPAQINRIKRVIEKKVVITKILVNINSDILGGFKLRVGDEIWDESVAGKIQQVKEAIGR